MKEGLTEAWQNIKPTKWSPSGSFTDMSPKRSLYFQTVSFKVPWEHRPRLCCGNTKKRHCHLFKCQPDMWKPKRKSRTRTFTLPLVLESSRSSTITIRTLESFSALYMKIIQIIVRYLFAVIAALKNLSIIMIVFGKCSERPLPLNHFWSIKGFYRGFILLLAEIGDGARLFISIL